MPTIPELAKKALDAQNAVNATGVATSMREAMRVMLTEFEWGTVRVNTHPIIHVYLSKLCSLNGMEHTLDPDLYNEVCAMAEVGK